MSKVTEDPAERASRYIATLEKALEKLSLPNQDRVVKATRIAEVYDAIRRYLRDARFYLSSGKATTSLASIAYAEGLVDALRLLELSTNGMSSSNASR